MDTDYETTQARYLEYLSTTALMIRQTLGHVEGLDTRVFRETVTTKKRVFFTGVGSSMPAAWHGANTLRQQGLAAQFLPTGSILGMRSLSGDDVVVLCSQGVNRADALLIIDKVLRSKAGLALLTSNKDKALQNKANQVYYFNPAEEKLFCRPTGVSTNFALVEKLCSDNYSNDEGLVGSWLAGRDRRLELPRAKNYIVLSSDETMPVAWNVALALREGCGVHAYLFDIETYGHGNYVGDLEGRGPGDELTYILVGGHPDSSSGRSIERILPFIKATGVRYVTLVSDFTETAQASMYILGCIAQFVYDHNQDTRYNMNRPAGKEENRYYHELDSYR